MLEHLKYKEKIILLISIVLFLTAISLIFIYSTARENLIAGHNKRLEKTAQLTSNMLRHDVEMLKLGTRLFAENKTLTEYLYITNKREGEKKPSEEFVKDIIKSFSFSLFVLYDEKGNELVHVDMDNPETKEGPTEKLSYLADNKNISGFAINNGNLRILTMGPIIYKLSPSSEDIIRYIKIGANIDTKHLNFIKGISGNDIFIIKGTDILLSTREEISLVKILGHEMEAREDRYSIKSIPLNSIYGEEIGTFVIALSQKDLAAALKDLKLYVLLIAFGSIVISAILATTLIRTLTPSLNRLVRFTEQVGSGKFPEETTFKGSDEVSVLGRHFLEMTKKLKNQKKALNTYTTGLEDAVMKRTQELFNSREEWVRTFHSITDYILIVDHDYRIVRANKALLDKIDLTNQELSGKKCYEIFCGENSPPERCPIRETFFTGKPSVREIRYSKLDGYFMVTASPLSVKEDEITGAVYAVKDITEHHNMRLQMIDAEKLASLGQMAAGFAHEINNPMASISGCTELLLDQLEADELKKISQHDYFHEYLNIIYREAFRCKDIIRGMLRFSRKQFEKSTVNINALLKEILSLLDHNIKSQKIHVVEDYRSNTNSLQANEGEIRQIFLALIINAIDAMLGGGTLTIQTQDLNKDIRITVKDTGSGIPHHIRGRIFEPFFTTKPVGKGTGLGLFIAFNMLKNYHGRIEVEAADGKGSTFTVTIPTTSPTTEAQRESQTQS